MTTWNPTEMARRLGSGLLSFPVTHFDAEGGFREDSYRAHCAWMLGHELSGLFPAGGTGDTYVDSKIQYLTAANGSTSVRAPLIGLSKHAANGTFYYEDKKFSARVSVAYRSKYLTAVPGTEGNTYNGTNATTNVDAQVSYSFSDRVKLSLEMINLTDELNDQFVDVTNRLNVLTHSGRQFNLGVRYAF